MGHSIARKRLVFGALAGALGALTAACSLFTDLSGLSDGEADAAPASDAASVDATAKGDGATNDVDAGGAYAAAVLADDPLVYLRLGEASNASTAVDATGHGHSGTLGNGHTFGVPGVIVGDTNTALRLDGMSSGIDLGNSFDFNGTHPYSLELWANVGLVDMTFRHFFTKTAFPASGREGYSVFVWNDLFTYERTVAGDTHRIQLSASSIKGRWAHLVATYDGVVMRLYIDGAEAGSTPDSRSAGTIERQTYVGCNDGFDDGVVKGDLDEVAIYAKALAADRVKLHFDVGRGRR